MNNIKEASTFVIDKSPHIRSAGVLERILNEQAIPVVIIHDRERGITETVRNIFVVTVCNDGYHISSTYEQDREDIESAIAREMAYRSEKKINRQHRQHRQQRGLGL